MDPSFSEANRSISASNNVGATRAAVEVPVEDIIGVNVS
jgi:hypothetical protein